MPKQENCRLAKDARESEVPGRYNCQVYFKETDRFNVVSFFLMKNEGADGSSKLRKNRDSLTLTSEQYKACVSCIGKKFNLRLSGTNSPSNQDLGIIEGLSATDRQKGKAALRKIQSQLFPEHAEVSP